MQFPVPGAPTTVFVGANYTGASADVVERTITLPIEEQVNGTEGMLAMLCLALTDLERLLRTADVVCGLSVEALLATQDLPDDIAAQARPMLEGLDRRRSLRISPAPPDWALWPALRVLRRNPVEALRHSGFMHGCRVEIEWVDSEKLDPRDAAGRLGPPDHRPRIARAGDRGQRP